MLIVASLILIALALAASDRIAIARDEWMMLPLGVLVLAWGLMWHQRYTPWGWAEGTPSPQTVEMLALNITSFSDKPGPVGVLWYGNYNPPILRYFRTKAGAGDFPLYMGETWDNLWSPTDYSPANRERVREEIKNQFKHASLVVLPEYLDDYAKPNKGSFAVIHFRSDWAAWINSPDAPRMRVVMLLQDAPDIRLVVLQREELARGRGDEWRLPYGNRPPRLPADYSPAVLRVR